MTKQTVAEAPAEPSADNTVAISDGVAIKATLAEQAQLAAFWKNRALVFEQKLSDLERDLEKRVLGKVEEIISAKKAASKAN